MDNLPAGPWGYQTSTPAGSAEGAGHVYLTDATGRKIACIWGKSQEKLAIVALILNAAELHAAAETVFAGLNARIEAADLAGPLLVFDGIAELHKVLGQIERGETP